MAPSDVAMPRLLKSCFRVCMLGATCALPVLVSSFDAVVDGDAVAVALGCSPNLGSVERWRCVLPRLYGQATSVQEAEAPESSAFRGSCGEVSAFGLNRLFTHLIPASETGFGRDVFLDLGSGVGKTVLQVAVQHGTWRSVGVEHDLSQCKLANDALDRLRKAHAASRLSADHQVGELSAAFLCQDVQDAALSDATIVLAKPNCLSMSVILNLADSFAKSLQPGVLILSVGSLPSCHRGLTLLRTVSLGGTESTAGEFHVYVSTPPTPGLTSSASAWVTDLVALELKTRLVVESLCDPSEPEVVNASLFTRHAVSHFATTDGLSTRLYQVLALSEGGDALSTAFLESVLAHRYAGDTGSLMHCFMLELSASLKSVGEVQRGSSRLTVLREVVPHMQRLVDHAGGTLVHLAARTGDHASIAFLLEHGASLHTRDSLGKTAIFHAVKAKQGASGTVKILLENGATASDRDSAGNTPLHYLQRGGGDDLRNVLERLVVSGASVDSRNSLGETPMHRAARAGHASVLQALVASRADPCATDAHGATPLHAAAVRGKAGVVNILLGGGRSEASPVPAAPRPSELITAPCGALDVADLRGDQPLHLAAASQQGAPFVGALLARGADRSARNGRGETPLHLAAAQGHAAVIGMLLA